MSNRTENTTFNQVQLELFTGNRLPRKPYCTKGKGEAVAIRCLPIALQHPLIQINLPVLTWWLIFDIDKEQAGLAWEDAGLPQPTWVAVNPDNGHAHIVYGLSIPVKTADPSHIKALRYLAAIYDAMATAMGADKQYSGLLTKNPTHSNWHTYWGCRVPYELVELAEYIDLKNITPKEDIEQSGYGRNCTLFDSLRKWAYVAVRGYRGGKVTAWRDVVESQAISLNQFKTPLGSREVAAIAKSVAKWVWVRDTEAEARFISRQAAKGAKGGKAKGAANFNKRVAAEALRADGFTQQETAQALGLNQATVSRWQKDFNDLGLALDK